MAAYNEFEAKRTSTALVSSHAPYHWYTMPASLPGQWMPYGLMLTEHTNELSNSLNEFLRYINDLNTWNEVICGKSDAEKLEITLQFIVPFATLAVNFPYVIRSRFYYSVAHLSHQANQTYQPHWVDDLPMDDKIYQEAADSFAAHWNSWKKLKLSLEQIGNKKYQSGTLDFRNRYQHRYSPRFEIGISQLVARNVADNGKVSYCIGHTNPIALKGLIPVLVDQHSNCQKALACYQNLVREQIAAITSTAIA